MKSLRAPAPLRFFILLAFTLFFYHANAQFGRQGMMNGRQGMMNGRQRSAIPQADIAPEKEQPKTAGEMVDAEMPSITQALELNDFETAVMSSILKKYVQERIEAQILKLPPDKMKEVYESINKRQDEELKTGLPPEKYDAFLELQKKGVSKTLKEKKKKKKKKNKS
jgi:hypothetical protein